MRPAPNTESRSHTALTTTVNDHHPRPASVSFSNTSQSLPPGTTWNFDIALPHASFVAARIYLEGPRASGGGGSLWQESAIIHATVDSSDAMGHSNRYAEVNYRVYCATYSKAVGDSYLTHAIFDSATGAGQYYILLQDAVIIGAVLRLTFRNVFGGSATLNVRGQALVY